MQDCAPTRLPAALGWHDPPVSDTTGGRFAAETLVVVDRVDVVEDVVDDDVETGADVVVVVAAVVVGGVFVGSVDDPQPDKNRIESPIPALAFMVSQLSARAHCTPIRCGARDRAHFFDRDWVLAYRSEYRRASQSSSRLTRRKAAICSERSPKRKSTAEAKNSSTETSVTSVSVATV